jgi:hypothetical protein
MESLEILIIVVAACVVIGGIIGALVTIMFSGREKPQKESVTNSTKEPQIHLAAKGTDAEIVHLMRDPSTGYLVLGIDGKRIADPAMVEDRMRVELQHTAQELFLWLGGRITSTSQSPVQESKPQQSISSSLPIQAAKPVPSTPQVAVAPVVDTKAPAMTIVEQIDEILQDLLVDSPLSEQRIKLAVDSNHGVVVWVGATSYNGIDMVKDPEVTQVLRKAVAEWERRAEVKRRAA